VSVQGLKKEGHEPLATNGLVELLSSPLLPRATAAVVVILLLAELLLPLRALLGAAAILAGVPAH
jgi:hypothetical protein